jgi:hypothetical protein
MPKTMGPRPTTLPGTQATTLAAVRLFCWFGPATGSAWQPPCQQQGQGQAAATQTALVKPPWFWADKQSDGLHNKRQQGGTPPGKYCLLQVPSQ